MPKCNCSGTRGDANRHSCAPQPKEPVQPESDERGNGFALPPAEFDRWRRSLSGQSPPRRYFADKHTDARMHWAALGPATWKSVLTGDSRPGNCSTPCATARSHSTS